MAGKDLANERKIMLYQRNEYDKATYRYPLDRLGYDDELFPYYAFCIHTAIGLLSSKRGKEGLVELALKTNKKLFNETGTDAFPLKGNDTHQKAEAKKWVNGYLDRLKESFPTVVIDSEEQVDSLAITPNYYNTDVYWDGTCILINAFYFWNLILCARNKEPLLTREWLFKLSMVIAHEIGGHGVVNYIGGAQVRTPIELSLFPQVEGYRAEAGHHVERSLVGGRLIEYPYDKADPKLGLRAAKAAARRTVGRDQYQDFYVHPGFIDAVLGGGKDLYLSTTLQPRPYKRPTSLFC